MNTQTATKWTIDPHHSEIQFKVKHLAISNVTGTFRTFSGNVTSAQEDFSQAEINADIDISSIDTNQPERDNHLRSPLFFDAEKFPRMHFHGVLQKQKGQYQLVGKLTVKGITKIITLDVEYTGTGKGRFNDVRAGFEANGKINRRDFGLDWSLLTETGSLVVGEEIKLHFDIQLIMQNT